MLYWSQNLEPIDFEVDSAISIYIPNDYTVQTQSSRAQVYEFEQ